MFVVILDKISKMRNVLLLMLFAIIGCNNSNLKKPTEKNTNWINPILNCHIPEIAEDIYIEYGESELKGKEGVVDFCKRMNQYFEKSNLSPDEALEIYRVLQQSGLNLDESIGQPSPDMVVSTNKGFEKQIALKKVSESEINIFYIKIGCGKTYFFGKFEYKREVKINLAPKEVWKITFPC